MVRHLSLRLRQREAVPGVSDEGTVARVEDEQTIIGTAASLVSSPTRISTPHAISKRPSR